MRTRTILLAALAAIGLLSVGLAGAGNGKWQGSIPITGHHTNTELRGMTKISLADAEKIALKDAGKSADIEILESELEVEHGFLVYCVELATAGQTGVDEIVIDAGTGRILAREHENEDDAEDDDHGDDDGEDHHDGHDGHDGPDHGDHGSGGPGDDHAGDGDDHGDEP